VDDALAEKFINEEAITVSELKAAIRRATVALRFQPVFMGSAFKNKGVQVRRGAGRAGMGWPPALKGRVGVGRRAVAGAVAAGCGCAVLLAFAAKRPD
jgi:hypothetical protein